MDILKYTTPESQHPTFSPEESSEKMRKKYQGKGIPQNTLIFGDDPEPSKEVANNEPLQ